MNQSLNNYIDMEVERVTSVLVNHAIKEINNRYHSYYIVDHKEHAIQYNTLEVNRFRDLLNEQVQKEFLKLENGNFSSYSFATQEFLKKKYPYFQQGYLCEIGFNALRGSFLFGNLGPAIPIKFSFAGFVSSDIEIVSREYGINNTTIEVDNIAKVSILITMPVSTRIHVSKVKNVLSFEIINGDVPNYYVAK